MTFPHICVIRGKNWWFSQEPALTHKWHSLCLQQGFMVLLALTMWKYTI